MPVQSTTHPGQPSLCDGAHLRDVMGDVVVVVFTLLGDAVRGHLHTM